MYILVFFLFNRSCVQLAGTTIKLCTIQEVLIYCLCVFRMLTFSVLVLAVGK
jgi:hypothetical protein